MSSQSVVQYVHATQLLVNSLSNDDLKRFWDLESVGIIEDEARDVTNCRVYNQFLQTLIKVGPRYQVNLTWKKDPKEVLIDHFSIAKQRLANLTKTLDKLEIEKDYYEVFNDYEINDIIKEVPADEICNPCFYLPHRPVIRPSSASTRVRPVFDGSSKGFNGVSINDLLDTGPSLIPDLVGVLLCHHRWPYAIAANVRRVFLNVILNSKDTDFC